jgi:hypothetical protein
MNQITPTVFGCITLFVTVLVSSQIADHHLRIHQSLVRSPSKATFTALTEEEMPEKGSVVGLDAEFVTLNQVHMHLGKVLTQVHIPSDKVHVYLKGLVLLNNNSIY